MQRVQKYVELRVKKGSWEPGADRKMFGSMIDRNIKLFEIVIIFSSWMFNQFLWL